MDILLINPYNQENYGINETTVEIPIGILSLAAYLENKGIKVGILDALAMQLPQNRALEIIRRLRPKVIGISVNAFTFLPAVNYTEEIKKISKDLIVIWGGPHPTIAPEICFKKSQPDFIIIGEGELTLFELMECILQGTNPQEIKGIAYRQNGEVKITLPRERISDLDSLPFPAYHLLADLKYYKTRARKKPFMGIITSRGCPYSCIYCSKDIFKNKITMRSPENIIEEIEILVKKYGVRQIDILDDNFTLDPQRVDLFCNMIIQKNYNIYINLQSGIRADRVDINLLKKMRKAGIFKLAFGVESGSKSVLSEIKKELDLDKVLEVSHLARKLGMVVLGFFMIGLPNDNEKSMQETIDFAIKMDPHIANFMMTVPFYGTELYRIIEKKGRFLVDTKEGISFGFYAAKVYYELNGLNSNLILRYYWKSYRDFYFRFGKLFDILGTIKSFEEFKWIFNTGINTLFIKKV